jgi:uncharacterized protein (DUF433 family)
MFFMSGWNSGRILSVKETAVLADVKEKTIRHEMSASVVRPLHKTKTRVGLGPRAVFYFSLVSGLRVELTKADRKDLFVLITHRRWSKGHWKRESGRLVLGGGPVPIELPTSELVRRIAARVRLFARGKRRIVSNPEILGGEPVFEGTRISVRHVGELAKKGVPGDVLREDFPALSENDINFARMYAELGRPRGRPKKMKFVRV